MPPAISVITPCLNSVDTIERTLDSVRDQGITDVEHVIVDGGSTDGTLEILAAREGLRWISEPDAGLSDALNKGLAMAEGELVGWLNADDWYLPGALPAVLRAWRAAPGAVWITGQCIITDSSGEEIRHAVTRYKNFWLRHYTFPRYLVQNFVSCPATFVRRTVYDSVGGYDLSHGYSMDYDLFLRVARLADPVILRQDLAAFTMVEGTKSMSGFESQFREHFEIARAHGAGHPLAVGANRVASQAIIAIYRALRLVRERRARGLGADPEVPS